MAAKLSPAGKVLWLKHHKDAGAVDLVLDSAGNAYVSGSGALVTKYDPKGTVLWNAPVTGKAGVPALALDSAGDLHVAGQYLDSPSFGGKTLKCKDSSDIYVGKLSAQGKWISVVGAGGTGRDHANGVAVDASGRAYVVGRMGAEATFGTTTLKGHKDRSVFVARVDPGGTFGWAVAAATGGTKWEASENRIMVDATGTSTISATLHAPGSFGSITLKPVQGSSSGFVARLDPKGTFLWAHALDGSEDGSFHSVGGDSAGNVYVAGSFGGSLSLPGKTVSSKSPKGKHDVLVARLDAKGNASDTLQAWGINGGRLVMKLYVDGAGTARVLGSAHGDTKFGKISFTHSGSTAYYLWTIAPGSW